MSKENRQHSRSTVNWPVTIKTPQETISAQMRDVSPSGAFIYCDSPMTPMHIFFLSIHIHSSTVSLSSMAESVWSTHGGMGVKFHLDRPEQGKLLSKFISDAWRPKNSLFKDHEGLRLRIIFLIQKTLPYRLDKGKHFYGRVQPLRCLWIPSLGILSRTRLPTLAHLSSSP